MKRVLAVAFSILMLCCLLLANTAMVQATEPGYDYIIEAYQTAMAVTADGNWATGEWDDAWIEYIANETTEDRFCFKMDSTTGVYYMSWLFDFNDTTDDADDVWRLCIDGYPSEVKTAPDANCTKIEITGHTTIKIYQGDGSGWVENATLEDEVIWEDSLTVHDVPFDYDHYCLEIQVNKGALGAWGQNPPPNGFMVGMYDDSNPSQGWMEWPPTDPDDPSRWGLIYTYQGTIPESLSFGVFVLLSSIAVAAGFYFARKRPKIPKLQLS